MNFLTLNLKTEYRSLRDDVITDFYNPVLKRAVLYKRAVGFFSSSSLDFISAGIEGLIKNGGKIQLIISPRLSEEDFEAIQYGSELASREHILTDTHFRPTKNFQRYFAKERLNFLSDLIARRQLEIKIATPENANNIGMFHEKLGLMYDADNNIIAFSGSMNETANAFKNNYESIDVFTSWSHDAERVKDKETAFDSLWINNEPNIRVIPITEASTEFFMQVQSELSLAQNEVPYIPSEENVGLESAQILITKAFERAATIGHNKGLTGVTTGFHDLDKVTNGLQKSELILLAARPAMGKTALALNIAQNAAIDGKVVAVFSLEMNRVQIGTRLLSSLSGVAALYLNSGILSDGDYRNLLTAFDLIGNTKLFVDDMSRLSVASLRMKVKRFKQEHGLDLIVIDYLQLMQSAVRDNRVQEISEISRGLKLLARELNIPILALSQLNRSVEMRADKRPQLSDLRDSGSLEQDADIVMLLYRDEYYNPDDLENKNIVELIFAKNRNGPTTSIRLHFNKDTMCFGNLLRVGRINCET